MKKTTSLVACAVYSTIWTRMSIVKIKKKRGILTGMSQMMYKNKNKPFVKISVNIKVDDANADAVIFSLFKNEMIRYIENNPKSLLTAHVSPSGKIDYIFMKSRHNISLHLDKLFTRNIENTVLGYNPIYPIQFEYNKTSISFIFNHAYIDGMGVLKMLQCLQLKGDLINTELSNVRYIPIFNEGILIKTISKLPKYYRSAYNLKPRQSWMTREKVEVSHFSLDVKKIKQYKDMYKTKFPVMVMAIFLKSIFKKTPQLKSLKIGCIVAFNDKNNYNPISFLLFEVQRETQIDVLVHSINKTIKQNKVMCVGNYMLSERLNFSTKNFTIDIIFSILPFSKSELSIFNKRITKFTIFQCSAPSPLYILGVSQGGVVDISLTNDTDCINVKEVVKDIGNQMNDSIDMTSEMYICPR